MLKRLVIATAASALLAGSAHAQSPSPQPSQPSSPGASAGQIVSEQTSDQMLASKLKGTAVIGSNDEKIGDVTDILFDKDAKVLAYVVGVGGFLGIGSKDVALTPASFQLQPATDKESMKLRLAKTKDELKEAAEFKPYKEPGRTSTSEQPSPTTGMAPGGTGMAPPKQTPATPSDQH